MTISEAPTVRTTRPLQLQLRNQLQELRQLHLRHQPLQMPQPIQNLGKSLTPPRPPTSRLWAQGIRNMIGLDRGTAHILGGRSRLPKYSTVVSNMVGA